VSLVQPTLWFILGPLLVASAAVAQPQPAGRQRQDRRVSLPTTVEEPVPEVRVASGNLTTLVFNAPLDRDTLEVDRTRFKLADTGERSVSLEPATELGTGERLVVKVRFKDRALPAQAVIALVSHVSEMDGKVEVDRKANTPEALLAALAQRDAELEELKARYVSGGPAGIVLSGWLSERTGPIRLKAKKSVVQANGLRTKEPFAYRGEFSVLLAIPLCNLPGQKPWVLGQVRLTGPDGVPLKTHFVQMNPATLAPGEEGRIVVETEVSPWTPDKAFTVELVDASGQRRLSFTLITE